MRLLGEALKNILRKGNTRKFPEEPARIPKGFRGRHIHIPERCIYCGLCAKYCPSGAITVDAKKRTWEVDLGKCLFCQQCEETCHLMPKKDAIFLTRVFDMAKAKKDFKWKG
ncbi:MAG: 4Fe-4S binding protein [Nanoarchaeota archaeon]|nr:4Fe-4S binding protein [Nanoarchaeota archaeon]MBU1135029.1 4Fe-4S binding protein [Nanoarchaeota archaeon]MBU2520155.1 4Fe-4S binding protein [Nanoarchaeota archaeon]